MADWNWGWAPNQSGNWWLGPLGRYLDWKYTDQFAVAINWPQGSD